MKLIIPTTYEQMIQVRELYKKRAEWLREKGIDQWNDVDTRYSAERLMQLALDKILYALEISGKIIAAGCIFSQDKMWEDTEFKNKNVYYIHGLVSDAEFVSGTMAKPGKLFLKFIEAKALLNDKTHICLDCRKENVPLNSFYEAFGFVERFEKVYSTGAIASLKAKYIRG